MTTREVEEKRLAELLRVHGKADDAECAGVAADLLDLAAKHRAACVHEQNGSDFDEYDVVLAQIERAITTIIEWHTLAEVSFYRDGRGATVRLNFRDGTSNSIAGGVTLEGAESMMKALMDSTDWMQEIATSSTYGKDFTYVIDLDERGAFRAHVQRTFDERCVFEMCNENSSYEMTLEDPETGDERTVTLDISEAASENEAVELARERDDLDDRWVLKELNIIINWHELDLVTDGFMANRFDVQGLKKHLVSVGVLPDTATLKLLNAGITSQD